MTFQTHRDCDISINGTHRQGTVEATYTDLVTVFGDPEEGIDKTDAEWRLEFWDGTVATIYNWKDGFNYCGQLDGIPVEDIREWHIGGNTFQALHRVQTLLANNT